MTRLNCQTLASLPAGIGVPTYVRSAVMPGIVHLGVGAFHRAHQAAMTEARLEEGERDWGIIAASLRSPDTREALAPQDGLYTLAVNAPEGPRYQVIGAISRVIVAPEDPEALLKALCLPSVRIVTLTITEKGYCREAASGLLDENHPDIRHDIAHPRAPVSAPGYLVAALRRRRAAKIPPFTLLCCDNLPANGRTLRAVVMRLAALNDPELAEWIGREVAFPCTMVDRIVPATTDEDRARVAQALGVEDAWPVMAEPFSQWVIEDHFPQGRPAWEKAGAEFVEDVAPYELMKLRMLNGAHSLMACLGGLAGHAHVFDAANHASFRPLLDRYWHEMSATLPREGGPDPAAYVAALKQRYANPAIRHKLAQIAMDSSQKIPQRWLTPLLELKAAGLPHGTLLLGFVSFIAYMQGKRRDGSALEISDPIAARFNAALAAAGPGVEARLRAALSLREVFGDLGADEPGIARMARLLQTLESEGVEAVIDQVLTEKAP